jgi:peptidoglycan/xylan/chitin deacetylase (PgdA/CDA1 family)
MVKKKITDLYKSISGTLEYNIGHFRYPSDELIVLCMHSTPADQMNNFARLFDFLSKHFKPIGPQDLDRYYNGELKDGPYLLFTFDDGLMNNLHVANWLSKKKVGAYFFLVPDFLKSSDSISYYRKNIRQVIDSSFDKLPEDFSAMKSADIRGLLDMGHQIGSHTYTHLLRAGMSEKDQAFEIKESGKYLEAEFGRSINAFCSPINTLISVDGVGKKFINEKYQYHFTTFPGMNSKMKNPQLICRRNIEVNWTKGKISFALGQWDLPRWQSGIARHLAL